MNRFDPEYFRELEIRLHELGKFERICQGVPINTIEERLRVLTYIEDLMIPYKKFESESVLEVLDRLIYMVDQMKSEDCFELS